MELKINDKVIDIENLELGIGTIIEHERRRIMVKYKNTTKGYIENCSMFFNNVNNLRVINKNETNTIAEPEWIFTDDEKFILKNISKHFNWIVRDADDNLYLYGEKPKKDGSVWRNWDAWTSLSCFNHLFQTIQWDDEEPCEFRKYIEEE